MVRGSSVNHSSLVYTDMAEHGRGERTYSRTVCMLVTGILSAALVTQIEFLVGPTRIRVTTATAATALSRLLV